MGWDSTPFGEEKLENLEPMGWDSTPFGEENPEHTGNGMGLYAFWRGESLAYLFYSSLRVYGEGLGQWDGTLRLSARRIPSLRVYGEGPGQEFRLCFCFVKINVSSATYTVSSSSQVEENSGQLSNAPKPSVRLRPSSRPAPRPGPPPLLVSARCTVPS
jgi:hypothetical protein